MIIIVLLCKMKIFTCKTIDMLERTLVILKPCTVQRSLIGDVINRFEKKGLLLSGMKMVWLSNEIVNKFRGFMSNLYAHGEY